MATCGICRGAIMWVPCGDSSEPLDVLPRPGGDYDFRTRAVLVRPDPDVVRFTSHRDTCPHKEAWVGGQPRTLAVTHGR